MEKVGYFNLNGKRLTFGRCKSTGFIQYNYKGNRNYIEPEKFREEVERITLLNQDMSKEEVIIKTFINYVENADFIVIGGNNNHVLQEV